MVLIRLMKTEKNVVIVKRNNLISTVILFFLTGCTSSLVYEPVEKATCTFTEKDRSGMYMITDFHQHTAFTDGHYPIDYLLNQGVIFGMDIMVNVEHGGAFSRNASIGDKRSPRWMESGLTSNDFKGDPIEEGNDRCLWRWQCIKEYSFKKIREFNQQGTSLLAIQGLEWNTPGYEHSSVGIITGQFDDKNPNADAVAQFEYLFDDGDWDTSGGREFGWVKSSKSDKEKTIEALEWLHKNYRYSSWVVPVHPERADTWHINDYRILNDVAPDIFIGFEGIPGHQASLERGGICKYNAYKRASTYGGVGMQAAKIGGLWDALISEGRRFWLVSNTDFHNHVVDGGSSFYPGEYVKNYIFMKEKTAQAFVNGLRSGNIYCVMGDLIDHLEFSVEDAIMGEKLFTDHSTVKIRILVHDPETPNHNKWSSKTNPVLDHIDLIAGDMRPKVARGTEEFSKEEYDNVEVIARFDATGGRTDANGLTSIRWKDEGNGTKLIEYEVEIKGDTYFRLRGTNHGLNKMNETDLNGNPLEDLPSANRTEAIIAAFEDLWFYSNPIFVKYYPYY